MRDFLPLKLSALWEVNTKSEDVLIEISLNTAASMNSESAALLSADEVPMASIDVEELHKNPDIFLTLKDSFLKAFKIMDRELRTTSIDCFCSGTTAVTLVKQVPRRIQQFEVDEILHYIIIFHETIHDYQFIALSGTGSCSRECWRL